MLFASRRDITWGFYPEILLSVFVFGFDCLLVFFWGGGGGRESGARHTRGTGNRFVVRLIQKFVSLSLFLMLFRAFDSNISHGKRNQITVHLLSVIQHSACHLACCLGTYVKGLSLQGPIGPGHRLRSWLLNSPNCAEIWEQARDGLRGSWLILIFWFTWFYRLHEFSSEIADPTPSMPLGL